MRISHIDFWMDDWVAGTVGLTHFERSVYLTICIANWSHGRPALKDDIRNLAPGRGFDQGWDGLVTKGKIIVVVDTNSTRDLHFAYNPRALHEHEKAMKRLQRHHEAGTKGGRPRKGSNELEKPNGLGGENLPRAYLTPTPTPTEKKDSNERVARSSQIEEKFAQFWSQYPDRKPHPNPRKPAFEKFKSKITGKNRVDLDRIIDGARLFSEQCSAARTDPKFIPTAVVWLNQDRWEDAIASGKPDVILDDLEPWELEAWKKQSLARYWRKKFAELNGEPIPPRWLLEDCPPDVLAEQGITAAMLEEHIERRDNRTYLRPPPDPDPPPPEHPADEPDFGF